MYEELGSVSEAEYQSLLSFIGRKGEKANVENIAEYMEFSEQATRVVLAHLQKAFLITPDEEGHFRLLSYYEALRGMADEASRGLQSLHPPWFEAREEYLTTTILSKSLTTLPSK